MKWTCVYKGLGPVVQTVPKILTGNDKKLNDEK